MRRFYRLPYSLKRSGQSGLGAEDPQARISASSQAIRAYVAQSAHRERVSDAARRVMEAHADALDRLGR